MKILGEVSLLTAFVASGFCAFAYLAGDASRCAALLRAGVCAAAASLAGLTACVAVLVWALLSKDFTFLYVASYSSRDLAAHYSLAALWVGQAGSLLLWAWMTAALAVVFRTAGRAMPTPLANVAFGLTMGYVCFLTAMMVFAADPMKASVATGQEGAGLSPLLQHPAMMIHPPIVFAGYAAWTIPCALALAALMTGQLDLQWVAAARPWGILAWALLGSGILLGANWAYEELGWGGYWGWDPVENGSLMPWLTGTVFIHSLMVWRYRDGWKKTALALAIGTFGLCNFATFLTRSGIFSSLHAFSQSPIGWMFLALMALLVVAGGFLIAWRRRPLVSSMRLSSFWARETQAVAAGAALLLLTAVVFAGTVLLPLSTYAWGTATVVGPEFYNGVLVPTGLLLLATTVAVPLLRWGGPPRPPQRQWLVRSWTAGLTAAFIAILLGLRDPRALLVTMLIGAAPVALGAALLLDARRASAGNVVMGLADALRNNRRSYAGFLIHLGFLMVAVGVAGSSLGSRRHEAVMKPDESLEWSGRRIRYLRPVQTKTADKLIAQAELEISEADGASYRLRPARHFHLLQEQWTTEVDIHSTWQGDFYTIFNSGEEDGTASLTLVTMPLMRWLWLGGCVSGLGVLLTLCPPWRHKRQPDRMSASIPGGGFQAAVQQRKAA
jgi:cytochrome c-type biogenesis protein CcmF